MKEKTIDEERFRELYAAALAGAGEKKTRDTVLRQLFMLLKRELELPDWPTTNDQDPFAFAIFEMVRKYGKPLFNPYDIWRELGEGGIA